MKEDSASETAKIVALGMHCVALRDNSLVDAQRSRWTAELLQLASPKYNLLSHLFSFPPMRILFESLMNLAIPGICNHYATRKIYIESQVRQALASGCEQLVAIAGGLDTLGLKIATEQSETTVIEIDHPATQTVKEHFFERFPSLSNFHLLPANLAKIPLEKTLKECRHFYPEKATVFVAEGLTMYLPESSVKQLLHDCISSTQQQSILIFTFMEKDKQGRINFQNASLPVEKWLKNWQEPFLWGLEPEKLKSFLAKQGLMKVDLVGANELRELSHLPKQTALAVGEWVCVAKSSFGKWA